MDEEYNPEFLSVTDENGNEFIFEVLDTIELDGKKFVAVTPSDEEEDDETELLEEEAEEAEEDVEIEENVELILLEAFEENGVSCLAGITDEKLYDRVEEIFYERLSEYYDFYEGDEELPEGLPKEL